jgi:hypothetical protein
MDAIHPGILMRNRSLWNLIDVHVHVRVHVRVRVRVCVCVRAQDFFHSFVPES